MSVGLLIETSSENCSAGIADKGILLTKREEKKLFSHATLLHPFIDEVLKKTSLSFQDINYIATGTGPGSYLGLRIGMAAAKGFAFALQIPLTGVSSLDNIFFQAKKKYPGYSLYYIMIDAGRMEVYMSVYDSEGNVIESGRPFILHDDFLKELIEKENIILAGSGTEKIAHLFKNKSHILVDYNILPCAEGMALSSYEKYNKKDFLNVDTCEPDYLKEYFFKSEVSKV